MNDTRQAVYPKDAGLYNLRGEPLAREGKNSEAILQFDEALTLDPTLEPARSNRQLIQSEKAKGRE